MQPVLVDTSVWVDYLRHGKFRVLISSLIDERRLAACGVVKTELIPFVSRNKVQYESLKLFLDNMRYFDFGEESWSNAIENQTLFIEQTGRPLGIPDLIIATICMINHLALFTTDKDLILASKKLGYAIYPSLSV